jgi:hypothetical protein
MAARGVSTEPTYGTHSCGRQFRRLVLLKASAEQKDTTEDVSRPSVWVGSGSLSTFRLSKSVRRYQTRLRIPAPIRYLAIESDFTALDFFGYANHNKPSSTTALSTVGATACTSALQRANAITQSTLLFEAFNSLIPSDKLERSKAKSEGASLISTFIPGLIPNFRASFIMVVVLGGHWILKKK